MNCREAEQLIPLFVEADLEAAEMQQVTTHVETCTACRVTVAEFAASQAALRAVARPVFDDALLAEMRGAVRQQIHQSAKQPLLVAWWQPIWNWRFAFAVGAVLLLIVGVVMSRRGANTVAPQVAGKAKEANPGLAVVREKLEIKAPSVVQHPPRMGRKHKASGSERNAGNDVQRQPSLERATAVDNQIAVVAPFGAGNDSASFPEGSTPGFMLPSDKKADEPEMLRMEIQTSDPNIKIIWLAPKEPARATFVTDTK